MPTRPLKILLVEDDPDHALLVRRELETNHGGVELSVAETVRQGKAMVAEAPPDLLLSDLILPDGRGTAFLSGDPRQRTYPVVLMTSQGNEEAAVEAIKSGAIEYVVKSVATLSDLPRIVRRALRQWQDIVDRRKAEEALREAHDELEERVAQRTAQLAATNAALKDDIAKRQQVEQQLRQSEARFVAFMNHLPGVAYMKDTEGRYLYFNPGFERVVGVKLSQWQGKADLELWPPEMAERMRAVDREVISRNEAIETIEDMSQEDGTHHWLTIQFPIADETRQPVSVAGVAIDITQRTRAQELMRAQRDLGITLSTATGLEEALDACLDAAIAASGMDCGGIYLANDEGGMDLVAHRGLSAGFLRREAHFDKDDPQMAVVGRGEPFYSKAAELPPEIRDALARAGLKGLAVLPVAHEDEIVACLNVGSFRREEVPVYSRDALEAIAAQTGTAIARVKAEEAVQKEQRLLTELLSLQERERKLVAYEIHDGLAQQLTGAMLRFQGFEQSHADDLGENREMFTGGVDLLDEAIGEARRLISGLRPPILDESGIVAAIEYLVCEHQQRGAPNIEFVRDITFDRLAGPLESTVFRVVQESLTNACRYSQSENIRIELTQDATHVRLEVRDWGIGFEPDRVGKRHYGLNGIRERARLLGGQATIGSTPGRGTRIIVELPLLLRHAADQ